MMIDRERSPDKTNKVIDQRGDGCRSVAVPSHTLSRRLQNSEVVER